MFVIDAQKVPAQEKSDNFMSQYSIWSCNKNPAGFSRCRAIAGPQRRELYPPSLTPPPPPISKMSRKRVPLRGPNFDLKFLFPRLYIDFSSC